MNRKKIVIILLMLATVSNPAFGLSGKIKKIYNYSYIDGMQVYWKDGFENPTNCTSPSLMTIRGEDKNSQNLVSMMYVALTTGYTVNCIPKTECSGINGAAEVNYCYISNE